MGCDVNGPGEARDADIGLAAGRAMGVIFRKGKILKRVTEAEMLDELKDEILKVVEERKAGIEPTMHNNPNVVQANLDADCCLTSVIRCRTNSTWRSLRPLHDVLSCPPLALDESTVPTGCKTRYRQPDRGQCDRDIQGA